MKIHSRAEVRKHRLQLIVRLFIYSCPTAQCGDVEPSASRTLGKFNEPPLSDTSLGRSALPRNGAHTWQNVKQDPLPRRDALRQGPCAVAVGMEPRLRTSATHLPVFALKIFFESFL